MGAASSLGTLMGTKRDLVSGAGAAAPDGGNGLMLLVQTLIALAVVYAGIRYLLPKFAGRLNRRLSPSLGSEIAIEESAAFAGGALYLVSVRGKNMLLSVNGQSVTFLTEVPAKEMIEEPTFGELLREVPEPADETPPSELLQRLARLGGGS